MSAPGSNRIIGRSLNRVYIIGSSGSGKTTLARWLGKRLDAPVVRLDRICYVGGRGGIGARYRPEEDRLGDVRRVARMEKWVAEGIYLRWPGELLRAADTVIWLDLPWRVAAWRIVARHVRRSLRGRNRYPGIGRLMVFVLWIARYCWYKGPPLPIRGYEDVATRALTERELAPYVSKVVHLRRPRDVRDLMSRLSANSRMLGGSQRGSGVKSTGAAHRAKGHRCRLTR